ncbi:thioredoxin family protein [Paenibacillus sp. FSL R5-0887]|jgi:thioredoxin-like negative regulator of GroEL|uniref:Thiol reductase thioredoxin n=1 Tax=Paenibacillus odorifer TaxID=189426 RepID=A0ABX3GVP6_9BACL|nr:MULTISPECIES: thioredoxin family protein [Paenibacillus]MDH6428463.1 thioredoxin-like negative regulator of GroEL [Paenibacillus sp. PastH-4]MDH6443902.1 thioredoxin-like negative regulator of GroEL [Paenibacillus sp. PastF-4]MDH6527807.1 thioredoxin-like negative regulator of GroEL [Paenibacillus sp. PastH-3]OMC78990.1 thiol reductase thioredoxin [Paenibacillus odorifer]OMD38480.1 thiol reductase thioredoxin [Paenibacillus odorifer]
MKEMNEADLLEILTRPGEPLVVFLHTPLCGTCKATERMLEVAAHLLPAELQMVAGNVNMLPNLVQQYRITSVPALLVASADRIENPHIYYSMVSVERILEYIRSVIS